MRNRACLVIIPAILMANLAHADGNIGDLSLIQSETLLLKAKVSRATAQSDLDAKSKIGIASDDTGAPVVKSVYGVGGKLFATFLYGSGVAMDAKQGDSILGGFKVAVVSVEKVELTKGGKRLQVGFSGTAPTATQQPVSPGMPAFGQPFIPTMAPTSTSMKQP